MRFPIPLFLLATWVAIAGACSSNDPEPKALSEGCSINSDCSSPLVCAFTKCHSACNTTRDCSPGQRCVASDRPFHVCQLETEKNCTFNSDCPLGQTCGVDLQCRDQCAADRDCVNEQTCAGGTCAEPIELTDGKLPVVSRDGGSDASSGHPCLYTSECPMPLICLDRTCAVECRAQRDCKGGGDCVGNRCVGAPGNLIGPEGGVVSIGGGKIQLTVPARALRSTVRISILPLDAWPDGALGPVYEIIPSGLAFEVPATLSYQFAPGEIGTVPPADLRLANAVGATWSLLATTLDPARSALTASLAHLSVYGVVGPMVAPDASVAPRDGGVEASPVAEAGGGVFDATTVPDAKVPDAGVVVPPFDCSGDIVFGDPNLKALVQYELDTSGEITGTDALRVTSLSIADSSFSTFDGFQCFSNLKTLTITSSQLTDISAFASLKNLTSLDLDGCHLTDFSPLAGLVNLTTLNLSSNEGTNANIAALGNLRKLTTLRVEGDITDVSPLAALSVLADLTLTGDSMTDLTSVGKLTALTNLILREQPSTSIAPLANLTKLAYLTLSTDATDISPLAALPKLVSLYVADSGTANLSSFAAFASAGTLTSLVLSNNGITDLTGLGQLLALTTLQLSNNQISNLTPIAGLPNLTYLDLQSNQITDLTPIAGTLGGDGVTIVLRSNLLNCTGQATNLATLVTAGTDLQSDCP